MRLIDADAMMQRLEERLKELDKEGVHIAEDSNGFFDILIDHLMLDSEIKTLREWINKQPTIEAEPNSCKYWDSESHFCALRRPQDKPVRRGYWIDTGSGQECSVCHEIQYGYDNYRYYCSNCGAKMGSEDE